jgi:uncharacterized protein YidB (DUF937 family)
MSMLEALLGGVLKNVQQGASPAGELNPLLQLAAQMLSNNSQFGGLAGLIRQFQQAGYGSQMDSWVSTGSNQPFSPDQLLEVFGQNRVQQMAQSVGMDPANFGEQFSQMLPQLVDRLTPEGRTPAGGFDDALSELSRMMSR